ncbi:hypothetical protein A374_18064 [Fictibacillus macauensis ZFHKF-1]|uniref:Uncharacterized protein n=1 Tax=Fictibacillus macauensis ZFHKF-1 TaxID=1196324 RepID=I8IWX9_9BACL|nr:hypothetical protein [Fictibacillus macauensis]EIT83966.1 hypothetical protein A374_18064 [Fictibacillus macauensis ZFHKF-1]
MKKWLLGLSTAVVVAAPLEASAATLPHAVKETGKLTHQESYYNVDLTEKYVGVRTKDHFNLYDYSGKQKYSVKVNHRDVSTLGPRGGMYIVDGKENKTERLHAYSTTGKLLWSKEMKNTHISNVKSTKGGYLYVSHQDAKEHKSLSQLDYKTGKVLRTWKLNGQAAYFGPNGYALVTLKDQTYSVIKGAKKLYSFKTKYNYLPQYVTFSDDGHLYVDMKYPKKGKFLHQLYSPKGTLLKNFTLAKGESTFFNSKNELFIGWSDTQSKKKAYHYEWYNTSGKKVVSSSFALGKKGTGKLTDFKVFNTKGHDTLYGLDGWDFSRVMYKMKNNKIVGKTMLPDKSTETGFYEPLERMPYGAAFTSPDHSNKDLVDMHMYRYD